jgi:hypothetical protein
MEIDGVRKKMLRSRLPSHNVRPFMSRLQSVTITETPSANGLVQSPSRQLPHGIARN